MFTVINTRDTVKTARALNLEVAAIFKVVINQQLLDTCLLLETLPSANAVADQVHEVPTVAAKQGEEFLKRCALDGQIQFHTLTNGKVSAPDRLSSAGAVLSLERGVEVLRYSDHDLQGKHASGTAAENSLKPYPLTAIMQSPTGPHILPSTSRTHATLDSPCLYPALVPNHLLTTINACHQAVCAPTSTLQASWT